MSQIVPLYIWFDDSYDYELDPYPNWLDFGIPKLFPYSCENELARKYAPCGKLFRKIQKRYNKKIHQYFQPFQSIGPRQAALRPGGVLRGLFTARPGHRVDLSQQRRQ